MTDLLLSSDLRCIMRLLLPLLALLVCTAAGQHDVGDLAAGLFYAPLHTNSREWRATVNTADNGLIHLWLKCIESEIRGYFFIDSRKYRARPSAAQASHALIRVGLITQTPACKLTPDRQCMSSTWWSTPAGWRRSHPTTRA